MGKLHRLIFWLLTATLSIYVILRALVLSFTIDEAMTYNYVIDIWPDVVRANNHFLNTQLMKVTSWLFGDAEWSLRLPNVLAFFLYTAAVYRITKRLENRWFFIIALLLLLLQSNLIEFFALARGYGLGMALWMYSMALMVEVGADNHPEPKRIWKVAFSLIFGGLAISAYAALLNVYLAAIALILADHTYRRYQKKRSLIDGNSLVIVLLPLPFLARTVYELLDLKEREELWFGTQTLGQWMDNTYNYFFASANNWVVIHILIITALTLCIAWAAVQSMRNRKVYTLFSLAGLLFLISNLGWVLEHELFGANYPQGRTNLVNYTLLLLMVVGSLSYLKTTSTRISKFIITCSILGAVGLSVHFASQINLIQVEAWRYSAKMKELASVANDITLHWPTQAVLEKHSSYRSNINYYVRSREMNIAPDMNHGISLQGELLLIKTSDFRYSFEHPELVEKYEAVYWNPDFDVALYARKDLLEHARERGYPFK